MKVYSFGLETAPTILLLPGTCCDWKGNFGKVIPLLSDTFHVLCVSYDGFDKTEHTEFSAMLDEIAKNRRLCSEKFGWTDSCGLRLLTGRLFCRAFGS